MRHIKRGVAPKDLSRIRISHLSRIDALGRAPNSKEIFGYGDVGPILWRRQFYKCCYCERKITKAFNDVEHYRPKGYADRTPGSSDVHGYWWLAYTWSNLLFSCPSCNRSAKNSFFPLDLGSVAVQAKNTCFKKEKPLFIDPTKINPVEHIVFEEIRPLFSKVSYWYARPRNGSILGEYTIRVADLNNDELLELRNDHWETNLRPIVEDLRAAIGNHDLVLSRERFRAAQRFLSARCEFSSFNFDVLRALVPDVAAENLGDWPKPSDL